MKLYNHLASNWHESIFLHVFIKSAVDLQKGTPLFFDSWHFTITLTFYQISSLIPQKVNLYHCTSKESCCFFFFFFFFWYEAKGFICYYTHLFLFFQLLTLQTCQVFFIFHLTKSNVTAILYKPFSYTHLFLFFFSYCTGPYKLARYNPFFWIVSLIKTVSSQLFTFELSPDRYCISYLLTI